MGIELITILATVILLATLLTLFFSFAAYFVTRAKKLRRQSPPPVAAASSVQEETVKMTASQRGRKLFERYTPGDEPEEEHKPLKSIDGEGGQWK